MIQVGDGALLRLVSFKLHDTVRRWRTLGSPPEDARLGVVRLLGRIKAARNDEIKVAIAVEIRERNVSGRENLRPASRFRVTFGAAPKNLYRPGVKVGKDQIQETIPV